ncbi:MAG: aminomethyl-transferring glycine dehydrogenase subunit GcvPA [Clostridiales bacterium]|nr:aminomethyl-transferring glycine dehydrogenase subunit GcvPA [Clostridiales bacterium]
MAGYLPGTADERQAMLEAIGLKHPDELYAAIPKGLRASALKLPNGVGEIEVSRAMRELAGRNAVYRSVFRGAGAYCHYIPSAVKSVPSREEFVTAYTPYQPELSQGVLQSIFEYQTMIAALTGMDASNASVYDGATAAAEATAMCRERGRAEALISAAADPMTIETIQTYLHAAGVPCRVVPAKDGRTDLDALSQMAGGGTACAYVQQPNYFGLIEDADEACRLAPVAGAKFIMGVNPIACALLRTPGEVGADIAVGAGQPLGLPLSFGGPYLGFMAARGPLMRRLPGRIVGETQDGQGRRAFVLTLQAREQHIRREKAQSNICTNQALCAMKAGVYMAAMGPDGMAQVAALCHDRAAYAAARLSGIPGFERAHDGEFFHEFVTRCPIAPDALIARLAQRGILGGLPVNGGILWCVTEMNTRADIDELVDAVKEAVS